jgi:PAS domain S-box-containing protein
MITLLYVDDEPALLEVCRLFLEREGEFAVATAASASEGLDILSRQPFDVIISDYQMPGTDGIDFLRKIRSQSCDTPFILFTGKGREEVVIEAINSGADSYIQKGGDPRAQFTDLSHKIRQLVRRKKAEDELRLLKFSVDHASEGVIWLREDGSIAYYNDAICAMLGYTREEFALLSMNDIDCQLMNGGFRETWNRLRLRKYATLEGTHRKKDSSLLPVELVLNYIEQGSISLVFAFIHDISERRRSEKELREAFDRLLATEEELRQQYEELRRSDHAFRETQQRYRQILEETDDWIWEITLDQRLAYCNDRVQEFLGYTPAEMVGRNITDFLIHHDAARAVSVLSDLIARKQPFRSLQVRLKHRNGNEVIVETTGSPVYNHEGIFIGFHGIARNITERKLIGETLSVWGLEYQTLLDEAGDAIFVADARSGMLLDANQKALSMVKRTLPEIRTMHQTELHPSDGKEQYQEWFRQQNVDGALVADEVIVDRDGIRIPVIVSAKTVCIRGRELSIAIYHDVSDIRAIRDNLQEKAQELDRFFTNNPDMLFCVTGTDHSFNRLSPAWEKALGYRPAELEGKTILDFVHPDDLAATRTVLQHLGDEGKTVTFVTRFRCREGSYRWLEWRAFLSGQKKIFAAAQDITERRNAQEALFAANRKLNLLADITRYDIRNRLIILRGYLDLFRNCPAEPYFSLYTSKIQETVAAITGQIENTNVYLNLGITAPGWQDLDALFRKACNQLDTGIVRIHSEPEHWEVFADPLLGRVFYMLIDNSLKYGTSLTMIRCTARETAEGLLITVEDDGVGIVQELKEQIFVKGFGKTTGLFLAREILSITGIVIRETGRAGRGARFEIVVPGGSYRISKADEQEQNLPVSSPYFISQSRHNHT